ncbi:MAG: hypothetical protein CFE29_23650 [Bradyrhizobiaceae bacterium PARB1]|jgi:hypothetical protein|nr:MAG: hypothetical protein CFE29_23650 [Bradyrhizobiaceae bacterium PARB1]
MSAEKVARLIADFDRPESAKPRSRVVPFDHLHHSAIRPQHQPLIEKQPRALQPQPLVEKQPAAAEDDGYERGLADGYARAKTEFEQKLEQERQAFAAQATEERRQLLNETAAKLAADVTEAGNELQDRIAGVTARILEPMITSAAQKQAVASFIDHLSSIATDVRRPVLRLTGPSELLELIRNKLGVRAIAIELRPGPELEASITIDQVVLETQLKVWADRLKLALQN